MLHNIYDAQKHINFDKIKNLLDMYSDKEIICFGGGTAAQILSEEVLKDYNVSCFLDNDAQIWGAEIFGSKICSPSILEMKNKGSYIVLVLSRHAVSICQQLEEFGLAQDIDYFDIYKEFSAYFRIKKFEKNIIEFLGFIDRIPKNIFPSIDKKTGIKAGIVCSGCVTKNAVCYSIAQCLVSMYYGYNATLIVDTLKSYDDYIFFENYNEVVRVYIDYVIKYIKDSGINIEVKYMEDSTTTDITVDEDNELKYLSEATLSWLDSRKDDVFLKNDDNRENISRKILRTNYAYIKTFFNKNHYDVLSVYTGLHKHRCLYALIAGKMDMRISSYDGGVSGHEIKVCVDGISTQSPDVKKIINNRLFSLEESCIIYEKAKELLAQRQSSTVKDNAKLNTRILNYQLVPQNDNVEAYDILIPLNIFWDSAALWVDKAFYNWREWLRKLIDYIYNKTNATALIREHPAQQQFAKYNFVDIYDELKDVLVKYSDRIRFVKADEKVNTYSFLKKARLVLPYTSTLGIEAAIIGKPVIMHTDIYYSDTNFVLTAVSQEEYFSLIKQVLEKDEYIISEEQKNTAVMMYYLKMKDMLPTVFTEAISDWMKYDFVELCKEDGVAKLMDCIYKSIPVCYARVKDLIE